MHNAQPFVTIIFMKHVPSISVVIPAYNEEKYITSCLTSITKQTFNNPYEIIVVDNNSTDSTAAIAKKFTTKVYKEKNKGYAHAMNAAVRYAKAPIIAVTDADCIVPPTWLETMYAAFEKYPDVVGISGPFILYDASQLTKAVLRITNIVAPKLFIVSLIGMNMAYQKSACIAVGGYDPKATPQADTQFGLKLKKQGRLLFLKHNIVQSSARRFTSPHIALYEYVTRTLNVPALKISGKTIFRTMNDYR